MIGNYFWPLPNKIFGLFPVGFYIVSKNPTTTIAVQRLDREPPFTMDHRGTDTF